MGDPKFSRRRYQTPSHPWQKERIDSENEMIKKYGLKNKKELWKAQSLLRNFRQRSRILQAQIRYGNKQAEIERDQLLARLERAGILGTEESLDDVLALDVEAVLSRRLQTLAYLKGLSNSPKQARQFITHGHVSLGDRKVTIPGYLVKKSEEESIEYLLSSPIANDMHPARPKDELELAEQKKQEEAAAAAAAAAEAKPEGDAPAPDADAKPADTPETPKVEEAPAEKPPTEEAPKAKDPKEVQDEKPKEADTKPEDKPAAPKPEAPAKKAPAEKAKEAPKPKDEDAPAKEAKKEAPAGKAKESPAPPKPETPAKEGSKTSKAEEKSAEDKDKPKEANE